MSRLYPHLCALSRMQAVGTNGRKVQTPVAPSLQCLFVPMSSRHEMESGFTVGSAYDVYFPSHLADVQVGDQLTWEGQTFYVRSARSYVAGRLSHRHVLASREGV